MTWYEALVIGWFLGVVTVAMYVRGRLMEEWRVTGRVDEKGNGYEVILKKGKKIIVCFRVKFERKSSANPDTTFSDQLSQATNEAEQKAASLNANERLTREKA